MRTVRLATGPTGRGRTHRHYSEGEPGSIQITNVGWMIGRPAWASGTVPIVGNAYILRRSHVVTSIYH